MTYPKAALTTDIIILKENADSHQVLLIKRKHDPGKDHWALPGGFVDIADNEDIYHSALRELEEETGLKNLKLEQFRTYANHWRDPRHYTASVVYFCFLSQQQTQVIKPLAGDDASEVGWFELQQHLPPLAFDHKTILEEFIQKTFNKNSS